MDLGFKQYHLPEFVVPEGYQTDTYLRHLCEQGIARRYGDRAGSKEVRERLDYELKVIHDMGFDAYFLIVWDLCRFASKNGIWFNARGSAAGSIVAYALDITLVDPIEHKLIFERFLNPGRISMPDIDLDFRDDRRAEMLEYCARKYGDDKVAQIITFGTMGTKAALRDVARVMDIPLAEVDKVAKLVPFIAGHTTTMEDALAVPEFKKIYDSTPYIHELVDTAARMEGTVRNAGTHAAGVVISDRPLLEYLPLHRPTSNSEETPIKSVTQFEMGILDSLGMLKVDFLGLATLSVMARACDLIEKRHGIHFDLNNIPLDDPKAFELMGAGQTLGVFQLEGSGMTRYLMQMKPKTLDHVIAMVALYRPGPMAFIPDYIARMHGEAEVKYIHEALRPIFEETYGIPVYQEQLMNAAVQLAGYTQSEADDLRKAISKKIAEKLRKHREKFAKGAVKQGIPEKDRAGDLLLLGRVRPLWLQQEPRGRLRRDRRADRLSEIALPCGIHELAHVGDPQRDREGGTVHRRCARPGRARAPAGRERLGMGLHHRGQRQGAIHPFRVRCDQERGRERRQPHHLRPIEWPLQGLERLRPACRPARGGQAPAGVPGQGGRAGFAGQARRAAGLGGHDHLGEQQPFPRGRGRADVALRRDDRRCR